MLQLFNHESGDIAGLVADLVHNRQVNRRDHRPIILVGLGFGGNLLKQIYSVTHPSADARPDYQHIHESIRGFVFLGTPHRFITIDDHDALWRAFERERETSLGGKAHDLELALQEIVHINDSFRRLGGEDLPAMCFYEKLPTLLGLRKVC